MGNWGNIRGFPVRPRTRHGHTTIISNEKGHLLPGVHRAPTRHQDQFLTTWELPRKITRQWCEDRTIQRPKIKGSTKQKTGDLITKALHHPVKHKTTRPETPKTPLKSAGLDFCHVTKPVIVPIKIDGPVLESEKDLVSFYTK